VVGGKFEHEHEARETQPKIGFHRARAQSALAGGARARTRFALETRAGESRIGGCWFGVAEGFSSTRNAKRSRRLGFIVLVLSPPWRAVLVLVLDSPWKRALGEPCVGGCESGVAEAIGDTAAIGDTVCRDKTGLE
jgi:hypothetical protein